MLIVSFFGFISAIVVQSYIFSENLTLNKIDCFFFSYDLIKITIEVVPVSSCQLATGTLLT